MVRILIVVVLVVKLLVLGWWAGLVPCPNDWQDMWSRAQRATEVLRGGEEAASDAQQWRRVAQDEPVFGEEAYVESVTVGGPGLVAVGWDGRRASERVATVWTTADGISWQRVSHDEAVFGGSYALWMSSVTAGGPGLVAVGGQEGRTDRAVVWTSIDGLSWQRVSHDGAVFGGDGFEYGVSMWSVTAGGPGLVAVGHSWSRGTGVVWTSTDGFDWQRIDHDEALFSTSSGRVFIHAVTAGGPGLVAVGWDGGRNAAAVWTSTDGLDWHRVVPDGAVIGGGNMRSVTVGGPGLVAVGDSMESWEDWQTGPAAVWTSADGVHWQRVEHDEAVFGGDGRQQMNAVTVGGPGLVAVGRDGDTAGVWTSVDGVAWQRVPSDGIVSGDGRQWMRSVTVSGPGLVAVGGDGVWISP